MKDRNRMIKRQKHVTFVGLWSCDETDHWCTCKSGCPSRRCSSCSTDRDWSCRDRARCSPAPRSLSSPERDSQPRQHADPAGKQSYMQAKHDVFKLHKQLFRQIQIKLNLNQNFKTSNWTARLHDHKRRHECGLQRGQTCMQPRKPCWIFPSGFAKPPTLTVFNLESCSFPSTSMLAWKGTRQWLHG